ncbi:MAG: DUF1871 family protein [Clostridia bacterium]|nr:DUF1871 family protein [Clostridia bacterium]
MNEILKIINEWDPAKLFPAAPKDEYIHEVCEIAKCMNKKNINVDELTHDIYDIFDKAFDFEGFVLKKEECRIIASKLINLLKN